MKRQTKQFIGKVLLFSLCCSFILKGVKKVKAEEKQAKVSVLFTHDMHSHLNSFRTIFDGEERTVGGFSKIKTIIEKKKAEDSDVLLLDGGDFSMGTLFQTIYDSDAAELRMLGYMGYDATTLGNHEFDFRSKGICNMLRAAKVSGDELPQMLVCNIDWSEMTKEQQEIKAAFDEYGVKNYTIVEKNGVKIAILGVFGKDALSCAPTCALQFKDPVEAVRETVKEIKDTEEVDLIVALSHSGTKENSKDSEDEILAKEVPELDLILSAHTHTVLAEPIVYGDTAIVSAGEYGERVGSFDLVQKENGRWSVENYELIPVTEDIKEDIGTQEKIDAFEQDIDNNYLSQFGYTADQVLAHSDFDFSTLEDIYQVHTEHGLGNFMADAFAYAVENSDDFDGNEVDMAVAPSGCIRDTYVKGDITVSDVYNSYSLGIGTDGVAGYPLVSVYLTGKEIKMAAEIDASVSNFMTQARLYMNGVDFTYNPNRMILNRVTEVHLSDDGEREEIEDDKLYRVVSDLYSGQMLGAVNAVSKGLLSIELKNADGTPVENIEDCIIYENGKEIKAWAAIANYMESFPKNENGISQIPEYYNDASGLQDRKVVDNSKSIIKRIKNPNKYAIMIVGVIAAVIAIVIGMVCFIVKFMKKVHRKKQKAGGRE